MIEQYINKVTMLSYLAGFLIGILGAYFVHKFWRLLWKR